LMFCLPNRQLGSWFDPESVGGLVARWQIGCALLVRRAA
jgi:hypothetical protein